MNDRVKEAITRLRTVFTPVKLVVLISVIALFWFLVLGDKGVYQFRQLLEMRHRLLADRTRINDEIDSLTHERKVLEDPKNLEMVIRSELGFIRPGEILFEEKDPDEQ